MTHYRVALWTTPRAAWYEAEIPVEALDGLDAVEAAMKQHRATTMGVAIVLSETAQEAYYDVQVNGDTVTYSRCSSSPRFVVEQKLDQRL